MKLGIIAGGGDLPMQLARYAQTAQLSYHVIILHDQADPQLFTTHPHTIVRMGAAAQLMQVLRAQAVTDIVMIGRIRRPSLFELRPDWQLLKWLPRLGLAALGDDGVLKNITRLFEQQGLRVRGVHEFLPHLLAPAGVWTRLAPPAALHDDITRGIAAAHDLGRADIGQAVVVQGGLVIAVEAIEGTDAMLARAASLRRAGLHAGVLVKLCKPQQDKRVDMPTIGVRTVEQAAAAGLAGMVVSAGRTLVDDFEATVKTANTHGLFICGVES